MQSSDPSKQSQTLVSKFKSSYLRAGLLPLSFFVHVIDVINSFGLFIVADSPAGGKVFSVGVLDIWISF